MIASFCIIGLASAAQSDSDYAALAEFLPAQNLLELESSNPLRYQRLAYMNRHAYYISQVGDKTSQDFNDVFEIEKNYENLPDISLELIETQELNLLGYNFTYSPERYSYYRIDDSGTVLVILPLNLLFERANLELE